MKTRTSLLYKLPLGLVRKLRSEKRSQHQCLHWEITKIWKQRNKYEDIKMDKDRM